jgi:hypothetical protein
MLTSEAIDNLIDNQLVRDEASKRGFSASPEELDAALQQEMSNYPLGGLRFSGLLPFSGELLSVEKAREEIRALLQKGDFLTEEEHRTHVLEATVLRRELQEALGADVKTSGEQVRARHILVETEEQAKQVQERLGKGEDFAAIAKEVSTDTSNKDQGGDLGWFTRGRMVQEFEQAAFSLKPGETSGPVKTTFGPGDGCRSALRRRLRRAAAVEGVHRLADRAEERGPRVRQGDGDPGQARLGHRLRRQAHPQPVEESRPHPASLALGRPLPLGGARPGSFSH